MHAIDIKEDYLLSLGHGILESLLTDRTTGEHIIWATDDYASEGEGYGFSDQITAECVTGEHKNLLQPRVVKARNKQFERTKEMAEVFTPSWVCNSMANLIDHAWFGRKDVFNVEDVPNQTWKPTTERITFPEGKSWQEYVTDNYLEFTCGEAPFLASRYDAVTGEQIPIERRIGVLDRKLRIVNENVATDDEWLLWTQKAFKSIYGYEWQGDNLLLARESLLASFSDYYEARFSCLPSAEDLAFIAYVISWNLWQMDGLKCVIPRSCHDVTIIKPGLFEDEVEVRPCEGCVKNDYHRHNGIYCIICNWKPSDQLYCKDGETGRFVDLSKPEKK